MTLFGSGYLFSRNSTLNNDGSKRIQYWYRFVDKTTGKNVTEPKKVLDAADDKIVIRTPQLDNPSDNLRVEVSPDLDRWFGCDTPLKIYQSAVVTSVSPNFGRIKNKGTLKAYGHGFDCEDPSCPHLKCSFATKEARILTDGKRIDSNTVQCDIPSVSRPEVTQFSITLNGYDFTNDNVTFTFYDAFILALDPPIVPMEGDTKVKVIGYGFADSGYIKVKFEINEQDLLCGQIEKKPCRYPADYLDSEDLLFVAPPEADVFTSDGKQTIRYKPFSVEASIYGDSFTDNNITLQYYDQPYVGNITVDGSPYQFHKGSADGIDVPIQINYPNDTDHEEFRRKMNLVCRYTVGDEVIIVQGTLQKHPLPSTDKDNKDVGIYCPVPKMHNDGPGTLDIAINGQNFVGDLPIEALPQLGVVNINPQCGPMRGGTHVTMKTQGFGEDDIGQLFFTWATVCTTPIAKSQFDVDTITTVAPPVPKPVNSTGGIAFVFFAMTHKSKFINGTEHISNLNHLESYNQYLYYEKLIVKRVYPHSGYYKGGTPVVLEGAFFFQNLQHHCTPKCKFGDKIVEAEYINTVRIRCTSPPDTKDNYVKLTLTYNGEDLPEEQEAAFFTFTDKPVLKSISPTSGPTTGGTLISVVGENFVDLSRYPEEYTCVFQSLTMNIPAKKTPVKHINETHILCTSPGGWASGDVSSIDISFNGIETSKSDQTFRFYQIDRIEPLSGPAKADGNVVTIYGSGFVDQEGVACRFGNKVVNATFVNWTNIECPIPSSERETDFYRVDFLYTLNGRDWNEVLEGFVYYEQPKIIAAHPPFIAVTGGNIVVEGVHFREDFYGANLTCKIADNVVPGFLINGSAVSCSFDQVANPDKENYIQIALNTISYTPKIEQTKISVFDAQVISPSAGVREGGT
mmetsp:Transcript_28786/g.25974  ORF Transcript_28786/g.25974 Transcript_28786/m.25974 type:complete len:908 (-) Transcript_28786:1267-3990(-)